MTTHYFVDCFAQFRSGRMLENKGHWTKLESRRRKVRIILHCQENKSYLRRELFDPSGSVESVQKRHSYIGDNYIRLYSDRLID